MTTSLISYDVIRRQTKVPPLSVLELWVDSGIGVSNPGSAILDIRALLGVRFLTSSALGGTVGRPAVAVVIAL